MLFGVPCLVSLYRIKVVGVVFDFAGIFHANEENGGTARGRRVGERDDGFQPIFLVADRLTLHKMIFRPSHSSEQVIVTLKRVV